MSALLIQAVAELIQDVQITQAATHVLALAVLLTTQAQENRVEV